MTARLTLQPVAPVQVNATFGVSGSFLLVPNFTYQNDKGPTRSLPIGSQVPTSLNGSFAFIHPAFTTPAVHNIRVTEATTGATATVSVTIIAGPPPPLPPPVSGSPWSVDFSNDFGVSGTATFSSENNLCIYLTLNKTT